MGKYFFHQKYPLLSSDLKNVVTKDFSMQPFANFLQIRCYCKFLDNHKKDMSWRYLLESLFNACFNKVTILMACNFIKKETTPQKKAPVFSCGCLKSLKKTFYATPLVAASETEMWMRMMRFLKDRTSSIFSDLYEMKRLNK